jgi:acyl-CoA synthetase (AMP-forming)/AMP-acid ligase II
MRVDESVVVHAHPSAVWDIICDPRTYPSLVVGVTRWEPLHAAGATGVGARYAMRMRIGSADVGGNVEIVEYQPRADIAWTAVTGIEQRGRWRVRAVEPGLTRVTLRIAYQSPGGLAGLLADQVSARQVRGNVRDTLEALRGRFDEDADGPLPRHSSMAANLLDAGFVATQLRAALVLRGAGVLRPVRPDRLVAAGLGLYRWGFSLQGGYAVAAALHPDAPAIIDDAGTLSFAEVDQRTDALAAALAEAGIVGTDRVALLCRNHRGIVEATVAVGKLGADVLFLNTSFAGPQLAEVIEREEAAALIHDAEFAEMVSGAVPASRCFIAWPDPRVPGGRRRTLARLIEKGGPPPPPGRRTGRLTILTSGTSGSPKGAERGQAQNADPAAVILSRIPLRARETTLVASPLFHTWGLANWGLGLVLSSTLVLQRHFDPEAMLAAIDEHQVSALAAVPVMLRRILELPESTRRRYDTSSLRVVAVSGSALDGDLATRFMDAYGDVLYNLYGSTEAGWVTIATPEDLRAAPGTAGRAPLATRVRLLDERGREVEDGQTGRIFVANRILFDGYTGGGSKDIVDGMMATGDVGRFDEEGRLFVEGRDDEMLITGGENVFPAEIEDTLLARPDVADVAVTGVADEEWGQRIVAYVVRGRGATLSADDVRDHVRARLARYKVPRDVVFVKDIPRNGTGKVVRRELAGAPQEYRRTAGAARPRRSR